MIEEKEKTMTTIYIMEETRKKLKIYCAVRDTTMIDIATKAIEKYMEENK